nr:hypothetical protein CFP56_00774 [Quercus suber]
MKAQGGQGSEVGMICDVSPPGTDGALERVHDLAGPRVDRMICPSSVVALVYAHNGAAEPILFRQEKHSQESCVKHGLHSCIDKKEVSGKRLCFVNCSFARDVLCLDTCHVERLHDKCSLDMERKRLILRLPSVVVLPNGLGLPEYIKSLSKLDHKNIFASSYRDDQEPSL